MATESGPSRADAVDHTQAYKEAGVDLDGETRASRMLGNLAATTHENRPEIIDGGLSIDVLRQHPGLKIVSTSDGIGNKGRIAALVGDYSGLGHDLLAMNLDDLACTGTEPIYALNNLYVPSADLKYHPIIEELGNGIVDAANTGSVAILGGETAQHSHLFGEDGTFNVDWGGFAVGVSNPEKRITGEKIKPGDVVIGLAERGFRVNGNSLILKTFGRAFGQNWAEEIFDEQTGQTLGQAAIAPAVIYASVINELNGGYNPSVEPKVDLHGVANITGNGIPRKLGELLRVNGVGADIYEPLTPPAVMSLCQEMTLVGDENRPMTDEESYTTLHMGQGMVVIVDAKDVDTTIETSLEHDIPADVIGFISKDEGISIKSAGVQKNGEWIHFPPATL